MSDKIYIYKSSSFDPQSGRTTNPSCGHWNKRVFTDANSNQWVHSEHNDTRECCDVSGCPPANSGLWLLEPAPAPAATAAVVVDITFIPAGMHTASSYVLRCSPPAAAAAAKVALVRVVRAEATWFGEEGTFFATLLALQEIGAISLVATDEETAKRLPATR